MPPNLRIARIPRPKYILCALDLKAESHHTLEFAIEVAARIDASIELLHVAPEGRIEPARSKLVKIQEEAGTDVEMVLAGRRTWFAT